MRINTMVFAALTMVNVATAAAQSVTFGPGGVSTGDRWTDVSSSSTSATANLNDSYRDLGPQPPSTSSKTSAKTVTVTDVAGNDRINEFEAAYSNVVINGTDMTSLFAGKRYRVSVNGNHVSAISYPDGGTPTATEIAFVSVDNARVGQFRAMQKTFGGKSVSVGDELHASHPEDLIDVDAGFSISDFTMKLQSVSGEGSARTATFALTMNIANSVKRGKGGAGSPYETSSMSMNLTGTLTALVESSRITGIELGGPATFSGRKGTSGVKGKSHAPRETTLSGSGEAAITSSFSYP
jgi:hypothetical protein